MGSLTKVICDKSQENGSKEGQLEVMDTLRVEGWKNALVPPTDLQIQNRFSALSTGENKQELSGNLSELTKPKLLVYMKEKKQVVVTGDSLPWGQRCQFCGLSQAGISGSLLSQS